MPSETEIFITLLAMEHAALDRWGRGDPSGFLEISDEDVVYFDPFRECWVDGLPALSALYESFRGQVQLESYEILNPKVQTWNGGAVLTFNYTSTEQERQSYPLELHRGLPPDRRRLAHHPDPLVVHQGGGIRLQSPYTQKTLTQTVSLRQTSCHLVIQ